MTGGSLKTLTITNNVASANSVDISSNGRLVATGDGDAVRVL